MSDITRDATLVAQQGVRSAHTYRVWIFHFSTMEIKTVKNWQITIHLSKRYAIAISLLKYLGDD